MLYMLCVCLKSLSLGEGCRLGLPSQESAEYVFYEMVGRIALSRAYPRIAKALLV